jgi:hypothetical protein
MLAVELNMGKLWETAFRTTTTSNGLEIVHDPYTIAMQEKDTYPRSTIIPVLRPPRIRAQELAQLVA